MTHFAGRIVALAAAASVMAAPMTAYADKPLWEALEPAPLVVIEPSPHYLALIKSYGPSGSPASGNGGANGNGLEFGESEFGSLGCVVGGTVGMGTAMYIGAANISNLIAGGLVPAASPAALYASLFGVVFATFCAVGQAVTPLAIYGYKRYMQGPYEDPMLMAPTRPGPILGRAQKVSYEPR